MDRIALLIYTAEIKTRSLNVAHEADLLSIAIREAELVDEPMLIARAHVLSGKVEVHRDSLRVLRHPLLIGRWCIAVGSLLLRAARALR